MLYDADSNSSSTSSDIAGVMFFAPRSKLNIQREFQLYDGGSLVRETIGILQGALHQKNAILFRHISFCTNYLPQMADIGGMAGMLLGASILALYDGAGTMLRRMSEGAKARKATST